SGLIERAFAWRVGDRLASDRIELRDGVMAGLATHQDAPHRTGRADAQGRIATLDLVARRVAKIGTMAFAGVDHRHTAPAERGEHAAAWFDRNHEPGHVVAERRPETSGLKKIALHV